MTDWDGFQAQVHPGDGIIARTVGGALVIPRATAEQQQTVDQLIGLIRAATPTGGRTLARKLAGILASADGDDSVDLALLAPLTGGDIAVLVVGDVDVTADTSEGQVTVSGRDSLTWVDRVLRAPTSLVVSAGSGGSSALGSSDLAAGIVPGAGLSLVQRGSGAALVAPKMDSGAAAKPAERVGSTAAGPRPVNPPPVDPAPAFEKAPPPPVPAVVPEPPQPPPPPPPQPPQPPQVEIPPAQDFQVESLHDHAPPQRERLPVDAEPMPPGSTPSQVKGVYCKRGHFNDPMVQFCTVCGINMVQQTPALVDGPRPPLGVLVFDDGSVFQLERDYVLGRQPEGAPEVLSGSAFPLRLDDEGGTVSRAHALIALEDWTVRLSDHGSANGTYIAMPNSPDWQQVPQNGRILLTPGTTIKLGSRTLKYESHRGQR